MSRSSSPRIIALLGNPVAHSLSPRMHNAGFQATGLNARYIARQCSTTELCGIMSSMVAEGGAGNITVPHKVAAVSCGMGDSRVRRLGMANVFSGGAQGVTLANTDVAGMLALARTISPLPKRWLIAGTGGSARAVAAAAGELGASVASLSRSPVRASQFQDWCRGIGCQIVATEECDLLVNATPMGLSPNDPPLLDLAKWPGLRAVLDLPYRAEGTTPLVESARERGLQAADGLEMLLVQGVEAWAVWFPGVAAPVEVMREALRHGPQ